MAAGFNIDLELDDSQILLTFLRQARIFSSLLVMEPTITAENFGVRVQFVRGQIDLLRVVAAEVSERASVEERNFESVSNDQELLKRLDRVGLQGQQLHAKMSVINEWSSHFFDQTKSSIKAIRMVLDNAISILDSISVELPGFEFLKEFYELIKNAIESINHAD
ncbi:MAG: hypothetical protein ACK46Q_00535 [Hyphomonas sp.]